MVFSGITDQLIQNSLDIPQFAMHMDTSGREVGFINSQPSMAEFMTGIPHLPEAGPQGSLYPLENGDPVSPSSALVSNSNSGNLNVPEYPWMKEKKSARKSHQQGKKIPTNNTIEEICEKSM